jgi:hypothetical protein
MNNTILFVSSFLLCICGAAYFFDSLKKVMPIGTFFWVWLSGELFGTIYALKIGNELLLLNYGSNLLFMSLALVFGKKEKGR